MQTNFYLGRIFHAQVISGGQRDGRFDGYGCWCNLLGLRDTGKRNCTYAVRTKQELHTQANHTNSIFCELVFSTSCQSRRRVLCHSQLLCKWEEYVVLCTCCDSMNEWKTLGMHSVPQALVLSFLYRSVNNASVQQELTSQHWPHCWLLSSGVLFLLPLFVRIVHRLCSVGCGLWNLL